MSHVQTVVNDAGFENNGTTPAINATSGNVLIAACSVSGSTITAIADNFGNTWVQHPDGPLNQSGAAFFYCWYTLNAIGGTGLVVTFTDATGGQKATAISEFSGRSKTTIDKHGGTLTAGSTAQTGPTLTGVAALADIWALDFQNFAGAAVAWTPSSGFTIPTNGNVSGTVNMPASVEYQNSVSAGNFTPAFTSGSANQGAFFALSLPSGGVANTAPIAWVV